MRRLPTYAVTLLSLAAGFVLAWGTYRHAWQIPVVQNLRGAQLFCALWIVATPLATLIALLARLTTWRPAARSGAIFLCVAVPAFGITSSLDKVRTASRDKAILCNLRQLAAAADQYLLENNGAVICRYEDLVGPNRYLKALNPVTGEDYRASFPFRQGGVLSAEYPSSKVMNYNTGSDFPGYKDVFAPGEIPPWRANRPGPGSSKSRAGQATPGTGSNPTAAPSTGAGVFSRLLGIPVNPHRQNLVCANCHPRKP